jgi:peptidyl-prolyl cis-trans isomerase B (cyclophilin B)
MKRVLLALTAGLILYTLVGCNEPKTEYPIRNKDNKFVTLETNLGNITLELYHDVAPAHADSFYARTTSGFYDGLIFHRIMKGFMMQGGDPTGTGSGDAGYRLKAEFSDLPHEKGTLSMARSNDPNSASCQFFICFAPATHLNGQYTVFGHVVNGIATVEKVEGVEVGAANRPVEEVKIIKAYASDAEGKAKE